MMIWFLVVLLAGSPLFGAQQQTEAEAPTEFDVYWMVFLKKGPNRDHSEQESAAIQRRHLGHLARLHREGKILVAGPFEVTEDHELRGIALYPGDMPLVEVRRLASEDPAVQAGRLTVEAIKWWTAKGAVRFQKIEED